MPTKHLTAAFALLFFVGCAGTYAINSVYDKGYTTRIKTVEVIVTGPSEKYNAKFGAILCEELLNQKIINELVLIPEGPKSDLSLEKVKETDYISEAISKAKNQNILVIQITKINTTNGYAFKMTTECFLVNRELSKTVWRSSIFGETPNAAFNSETMFFKEFSQKCISRLRSDGLLD